MSYKTATELVMTAKIPRKRYYVSDSIPVEIDIRNHSTRKIKQLIVTLYHVTFTVVMGNIPSDQVLYKLEFSFLNGKAPHFFV